MKILLPRKLSLDHFLFVVLLIFIFIGVFYRLEALHSLYLNVWVTRDIDRSINLLEGNYLPLAGPETNVGGRLPGPILYLLMLPALFFKTSYESVFILNFSLNIGSLIAFFFIVKKYFGLQFSAIATILLCINLPHIGGVNFPINPSFLYPFIVLFFWGSFELFFNNNPKAFLLIVLSIVLGVQIHYSIVTYCLIPAVLTIFFKIRIPKKIVFQCFLIIIIFLIPFWFYKTQTFQNPNPIGNKFTFHFGNNPIWFLTPFGGNVIYRLFFENGFHFNYLYKIQESIIYFFLTLGSLLFLFFKIIKILKSKKQKHLNREIALFSFFYIPALVYEISNPTEGHQWYWNIFVIPQTLLIAYGLLFIFKSIRIYFLKGIYILFFSSVLIALTIQAFSDINESRSLINDSFRVWSYKNINVFYKTVMKELQIDPEEYWKNVYYEGNYLKNNSERPPPSKYLLKFIWGKPLPANKYLFVKLSQSQHVESDLIKKQQGSCFFIFEPGLAARGTLTGFRVSLFLNDKTIKKTEKFKLVFFDKRTVYHIIKYRPLYQQSCYNNTSNLFSVEPSTVNILNKTKDFNFQNHDDIQILEKKEIYDSNENLKVFSNQYLIYDEFTGSPFLFKLSIEKGEEKLKVKTKTINAYFFPFSRNITSMKIRISKNNDEHSINIIIPNTLAGIFESYNRVWKKEVEIPLNGELKRNQFKLFLNWVSSRANIEVNEFKVHVKDIDQTNLPKKNPINGTSTNEKEMDKYSVFTELTQKNTLRLY